MIKRLKIHNIGPAAKMELEFGQRLNLLTGDNGLGKSFLLDITWWSLTRRWARVLNSRLTSGGMAMPSQEGEATIEFSFTSESREESHTSQFMRIIKNCEPLLQASPKTYR